MVTPSEGLTHTVLTHSNGTSLIFFPVQSGSWWEAIRPAPKEHLHATDWPDGWLDLICPPPCGLHLQPDPKQLNPGPGRDPIQSGGGWKSGHPRWCRNFLSSSPRTSGRSLHTLVFLFCSIKCPFVLRIYFEVERYVEVGLLRCAPWTGCLWLDPQSFLLWSLSSQVSSACARVTAAWLPLHQRIVNEFLCNRSCGSPDRSVYSILSSSLWITGLLPRSLSPLWRSVMWGRIQLCICAPCDCQSDKIICSQREPDSNRQSLRLSHHRSRALQVGLPSGGLCFSWAYLRISHGFRTRCLLGREKYLWSSESSSANQGFSVLTVFGLGVFCFRFLCLVPISQVREKEMTRWLPGVLEPFLCVIQAFD